MRTHACMQHVCRRAALKAPVNPVYDNMLRLTVVAWESAPESSRGVRRAQLDEKRCR